MDGKKDSRLLEILNSYLEKQPVQGGNTDELDVPVPTDYVAQCLDSMPDIPETAAESKIHSRTESLLNAFIDSPSPIRIENSDAESDDILPDGQEEQGSGHVTYSETLAAIFLKQHRYDRALEIIKSLYLNFPNKSVYFADQIRYLEKLIRINQIN